MDAVSQNVWRKTGEDKIEI